MQDQFPGLKPGEKVSDYQEAMERLNQDFPARLREESDADYATRLQSKYPGIRAGQTVQIYQKALKAIQEDFPERRGDENDEAYAARMQDQFPGLKTGEKVSDYQQAMERLNQDFPGRLREESDADYAARMQSKYPDIRAGETPLTYQEVMKHLHIGFPDRGRDESATDYSIRMQGTYPGIQPGQTVAEYKSAMQELVKKFPGRNPGEGEGSYAARMQTQYPGLKPGETILNYRFRSHLPFTIPELGLEMVPIQPGEFWMGSPTNERLRKSDEFHHKVKVSKPFWMGKFEVTQSQWKAIMGTTVQELRPKDGDSVNRGVGDNFPMYNVSWREALNFCLKLNEREKSAQRLPSGHGYRLPTEVQWEYSCRAGTNTSYAFGSNALKHINMSRKTLEVGTYKPNPWGLHDMHGNVYEWCSDWYGPYNHKIVLSVDPSGPDKGVRRVLRSGSWGDQPQDCRSAGRQFTYPEVKRTTVGFRLCLSP
jgi:formylglycine-generating enzyme required for sulfatase activity